MKTFYRLMLCVLLLVLSLAAVAAAEEGLVLPEDLTTIEAEAFYGDTSLSKVVLPDTVTSIGAKAFAGSTVTEINFPASLTDIAEDAFEGCTGVHATVAYNAPAYAYAVAHNMLPDTLTIVQTKDWYVLVGDIRSARYNISSERAWTATTEESWISPQIEGSDRLLIGLRGNDTGAVRTGTVTVSNGANTETITIHQSMFQKAPTVALSTDKTAPTQLEYDRIVLPVTRVYEGTKLYTEFYTVNADGSETNMVRLMYPTSTTKYIVINPNNATPALSKGGAYKLVVFEYPEDFPDGQLNRRSVVSTYYFGYAAE